MTDYENTEQSSRSTIGTAITFLIVGLGIGAIAALLLAPTSGRRMRRNLRRRYEDAMEGLSDTAEDLSERGEEWVDEAKRKVAPIAKKFRK